ncbi:MAG: helix-turn-helix domain-containing protein [Candidatus Binataceae bacterium]|nr:helix-turn-helix domain-containing protein [Candidatus Binataceae bacterium]
MAKGGRTLEESARLKHLVVHRVLAGDSPEEAASAMGCSANYVRRLLLAWRTPRGITATGLREMQLAARIAREFG